MKAFYCPRCYIEFKAREQKGNKVLGAFCPSCYNFSRILASENKRELIG